MKKAILIFTLLILSTKAFTQNDSIRGNVYELKGTIINEIFFPPDCGYEAFATVVEFKISELSMSNYKSDTIAVIFTCPEFYEDDFFEMGKTYTSTIVDENQSNFGWAILNDSILKKYELNKKLWVIKSKKNK